MRPPTDWLNDPEQMRRFEERMRSARVPRRQFLAIMGALGAAAATAACGGTEATSTPATSGGATTAATTAAATTRAATTAATTAAPPATGAGTATRAASPAATSGGAQLSTWPANVPKPTDMAADQTFRPGGQFEDPSSFDYNKDLYAQGSNLIWEGLLRYDPDFNLCAGSAVSYEATQGGQVYVFKLNPQAVWSNGDPLTADDYVWSWTRQLNPETGAAYAGFLLDIKGAGAFNNKKGGTAQDLGLKAIDKQTLQVTLERPAGYFPILAGYLAAVPAHRPSVEKFGDKWTEPAVTGAPVVSNGPFVLVRWDRGKEYELQRNEKYATGPKPFLQKIVTQIVPTTAGLAPYESGQIDHRSFRGIPAGELPRILNDPQLKQQAVRHSQSGLWYLLPEVDKEPFSGEEGKKVRRAIQKAVNRDQIVKLIQNLGEPAYSLMAPDVPFHIDPKQYPEFKQRVDFNKEAALKELEGTKYAGGKNWPKIVMSMRDEGTTAKTAAEFIQRQLKENLGMEIELDIKPLSAFNAPMFDRKYQLIFIRWYMDYPDPNNFYKDVFFSRKASGKRQAWSDSKYDDLVLQAASEPDQAKRAALYRDAEKILQEEGVYSPLYYGYAYALFKPKVGGIPKTKAGEAQPDWNIFIDSARTLYIKK